MGSLAGSFSPATEWEIGIQSANIKNKVRGKNFIAQRRYIVTCLGCVTIIDSKIIRLRPIFVSSQKVREDIGPYGSLF